MQDYCTDYVSNTDYQAHPSPHHPLPPQNVIWILADQLRAQALSCNLDPNSRTPNIDNLAIQGMNFNRAVSSYPLCCPFRATLLTSQDHQQCVPGHGYPLKDGTKTIADAFNLHHYDTAYFGKWHVDGARQNPIMHIVPKERRGGFNTWLGYENNNQQWNTYVHGHTPQGEVPQYRLQGYETDELTNLLIDYLENTPQDQPFFAVLSVQPPHDPHPAPARNKSHFAWPTMELRANVPAGEDRRNQVKLELARYYAMIENLDDNIGRILDTLCRLNLDTSTHIVFFSDHGDMLGSHGLDGKVVPYEESVRIPFIISSPTGSSFGFKTGTTDALISEYDIAATTLGLCGLKQPDWLQGYDYSYYRYQPKISGGETNRSARKEPDSVIIKAIIPREGCDKAWRGIITRDGWKYVCFEEAEWLLFNLQDDPYEQINLAHQFSYREKRLALRALLQSWITEHDDTFILPKEDDL